MTSLRAKIVAGSFVPLLLAAVTALAIWGDLRTALFLSDRSADAAATLSLANDLGHTLTSVEVVESAEALGVAVEAFRSTLAALRARVPDSSDQRRRLEAVETAFDRWRLRPTHARLHAVTAALREFTHAEADAMAHRIAESRSALVRARLVALMGPLVTVAIGIFVTLGVLFRAIAGIRRIADTAEAIERGDLARRAEVDGRDEVARLAGSFNRMTLRLAEETQGLELLAQMGEFLQACRSPEEAYALIGGTFDEVFPGSTGQVLMLRASRDLLETTAHWGNAGATPNAAWPAESCWSLRRGRIQETTPGGTVPRCDHVEAPDDHRCLCVPLVAHGETLGVLHLVLPPRSGDAAILGRGGRRRLVALAEQIALSLSNLRLQEDLRQQSVRDPLTGLYNRRYLTEALEREIHRAARRHGTTALIAFDIDHFKRFNDTFGHDAGDHVLREIARSAAERLRAGDVLCRHGGEEFIVLLPDAGAIDAARVAEALRAGCAELRVERHQRLLGQVTLSAGVAAAPEHALDAATLLRVADDALYAAKRAGRNRVVVAAPAGAVQPVA
jgi:diguanylate cyclase (GGDEF)-like protein